MFFCCARNAQTIEALPQITIANAFLGSERRRIKSVGLRYGAWVIGVLHSVAMATRTTSVHVCRAKISKAYGGTRGAIAALRWHIYNGECKPRASVGAQWPAARGCCSGASYRAQQSLRSASYLRELVTHMIIGLMHAGAQGRGRGDAITALENRG